MSVLELDDHPVVMSVAGQGSKVQLFAMSRNNIAQSDFVVECDYNSERYVFSTVSFYSTMITSEDVPEMESPVLEYFEPRVGMYFIQAICRSNQDMNVDDTVRIYMNISGEVVWNGDCIVHDEPEIS